MQKIVPISIFPSQANKFLFSVASSRTCDFRLWHRQLGHLNAKLLFMLKSGLLLNKKLLLSVIFLLIVITVNLAKVRLPFSTRHDITRTILI